MTVRTVAARGPLARPALQVPLRVLALAAVALLLAALHIRRPPTLCPLRGATGIPCPFCGGTTAAVRLGHGDLAGALYASPLAVLAFAGFLVHPLIPVDRLRARWLAVRPRQRTYWVLSVVGLVAVSSEVWELFRYGLLT